jgi:hypothetical protein
MSAKDIEGSEVGTTEGSLVGTLKGGVDIVAKGGAVIPVETTTDEIKVGTTEVVLDGFAVGDVVGDMLGT